MVQRAARLVLFLLLVPGFLKAQEEVPDYQVRAGDQIEINFFTSAGNRLLEVAGTRIIDRNGRVHLPYVGSLLVEGLDAGGIRELLDRRFSSFYDDPVIDVTVRLRVNVTGAVRTPGNYFLDPSSTVIDAISLGGGTGPELDFGYFPGGAADASQVRLVRGGETRYLNLRPDEINEEVLNLRIQSGDWLHVPPRGRSALRENIQFASSIFALVGSVAAVVLLISN